MTLVYLDASAVIKLFIREAFTAEVEAAVLAPEVSCMTSDLTYAEIHGAFAKGLALGRLTPSQGQDLIAAFRRWFEGVAHAGIPFRRIERAGRLAVSNNLRGADAIHLSTALETVGPCSQERRVFACFDERLTREARATGCFDGFVTDPRWL